MSRGRRVLRGWLAAGLFWSGTLSAQEGMTDAFAGWPEGWRQAYQRFENYLTARKISFPVSDLGITPEGRIIHSVQLFDDRTDHLSVMFYKEGVVIFEMAGGDGDLFDQLRARLFPPGVYAAGLMSCGLAGYQMLYPLVWFETYWDKPTPYLEAIREAGPLRVRVRRVPPSEDFWPNERVSQFLDFHVFPHHWPGDIYRKNAKIDPSVILTVAEDGMVVRGALKPALERLLRWRVYFNGRLIGHGSATGQNTYKPTQGAGTYAVFVGVDGPEGFMPVSNLALFPLFPDGQGGLQVYPSARAPDKVPDIFVNLLPSEQRATALQISGIYDFAAIDALKAKLDFHSQKIFDLWQRWSYNLASDESSPGAGVWTTVKQ